VLEAPAGLVPIEARCRDGKVERVTLTNVASFADRLDATIELDGIGSLRVDTAFGGDSFVLVDGADLGFAVEPSEAADLADLGPRITAAANSQLGFRHPGTGNGLEWNHISFCQIAGPLTHDEQGVATMRSTTVIDPGKLDRSPTGTGVSARLAVLSARGMVGVGDQLVMRSIIDSEFVGTVTAQTAVGDRAAIVPTVSGTAWITGTHIHTLDPTDPWPRGYRLSDTWPAGSGDQGDQAG
jgi:proline racemase